MTASNQPPVLKVVESATKPARKKSGNTGNGGGGSGSDKVQKFGEYLIKNGMFHQSKQIRGAAVEFQLCNFTCKIVEEVIRDNDLQNEMLLRIEGERFDGKKLERVDVPLKEFGGTKTSWVNEYWGMVPLVYSGAAKKDNLNVAIHMFSQLNGDIPRRVAYRFTGWKKINDQWHYLTGSGAIVEEGLIDSVETDLGSGHMALYSLPEPMAGEPLKQAVNDVLALLCVCPSKPHIGAALLAAAIRAPLGECQPTDFAIWLYGHTGSRKSAIAALAQAFFGNFTARSFPANWSDTANNSETKSHQAKDAIFVVDDFKPSVSQTEAAKLYAFAERLIRNTGNQAGRGRCDANSQTIAAPFNRSMLIATAEELPLGASLLGRLLILEISRADVDNAVLTRLQRAVTNGSFTGLMAAYLQWLAPRLDGLKKDVPRRFIQSRDQVAQQGFASSHPRAPEIFANLVVGFDVFADFLSDMGLMTIEQSNDLFSSVNVSLKQAFCEQAIYQIEQDETERFLQILRAVLSSGNGHIACRLNQGPPPSRPFAWGWRDSGSDMAGDKTFKPMGDCIGWFYEDKSTEQPEVWLQQEAVFKVVQQYAKNQSGGFLISAPNLWRRMLERGLIVKFEHDAKTNKPRTAIKRHVGGRSVRVMCLSAELVESG